MLALILILAFSFVVSGCAGTAQGVDTSVYSRLKADEVLEQAPSGSSAMVIIRYPAMIHADAENLYVSSFAINAIGGEVPYAEYSKPQTSRVAQSVIEKSSYYAMSLYNELKKILPKDSVLLSPHIVVWDKERNLHSRPILATEQIPSVLTVDFNIYSYPDVNKLMDAPPVTFGDLVTPMIVVKSNRWIQPALNGLLISSRPLISSAWRQTQNETEKALAMRLEDVIRYQPPSLDFIAFLRERNEQNTTLPLKTNGKGNGIKAAIEPYSVEKIQMSGAAITRLPEDFSADPFVPGFVRGASTRIVEVLNSIDHNRATFFARQIALNRFDTELAKVFFIQSTDESIRARMLLADALIGAEREFLAAQSESIYAGTYTGNYGLKMRRIIAAEYHMLEERRQLARTQNVTTAVAVIGLAGAVYGAAVASTAASTAAVAAASAGALTGSVWAMHNARDIRAESGEVSRYFLARMAPAFDRQMSVQMEWLESKELITARGFAEFRNKTLSLYQSRVRSMSINAEPQCRFTHPDFVQDGRWFGVCANNRASGRGYGLIVADNGDSLEFIGDAEQGLASGQGGMIIRRGRQVATTYYEGGFKQGLPDGVVRIQKTGAPTRVRKFSNGADVGKGNPDGLRRLEFATSTPAQNLSIQ